MIALQVQAIPKHYSLGKVTSKGCSYKTTHLSLQMVFYVTQGDVLLGRPQDVET